MVGWIVIKNSRVLESILLYPFHPKLIPILDYIRQTYPQNDLIITEGWRTPRHPGDVHSTIPVRAVDLRSWHYENPGEVAYKVNLEFIYDPDRPWLSCCVYHNVAGWHFHIQVHPNTRRRGDV